MTFHHLSREEWLHPSAYDYHPDAVHQLRVNQPYWRAWLNEHATAAWFGFAAGMVCVAVPCAVALAVVL